VWRAAVSAAESGLSAFSVITGAARELPPDVPASVLPDLATSEQIATMAGGMAAAKTSLTAAADTDQVTGAMISLAPWSMDLNAFNTMPGYDLIIGYSVEGQELPVYRVLKGVTSLPSTAGGVRDLAQVNAAALAGEEGQSPTIGGGLATVADITITIAAPLQ